MKYLIALALTVAGPALGQTYTTCQRMDSQTINCESSTSHLDTKYWHPDIAASGAKGFATDIADAQAMTNGPLQTQLLQQQLEQQRLQSELLAQQLEVQRRALAAQSEAQDHQMRLERLQRSFVSTSICLNDHTPQECSSNPDTQAAREDIASGRISQKESLEAITQGNQAPH
jgi:hypothetical protein